MRRSNSIVTGTFFGGEVEPGTFHVLALPPDPRRVRERVTETAYGRTHAQIGSAPEGSASRAWVPTPDDEEVTGARR